MGTPRLAKSLLSTCCARVIPCRRRSTLLPFLYQTSTIQSLSTTAHQSAPNSRASRPRGARPRKATKSGDDIPFEPLEEQGGKPDGPIKAEKDNSSLSATERVAFEKLFDRLGRPAAQVTPKARKATTKQNPSAEVANVQSLTPEQRDVYLARLPESIRPLAKNALQRITDATKSAQFGGLGKGVSAENHAAASTPEDDADAELERHLNRTEALFHEQRTDLGVWEVLRRELFEPLKLLDLDGAQHEGEGKKKKKKGSPIEPTTTASPEMVLTSLPHITLLAVETLHERYPASQLSLSILPQLKRISRTAHTLALSPDLYASVLSIDWSRSSSPSSTISILEDMETEGVELDRTVLASLLSISQEATAMRTGAHGDAVELICSMEGWDDRLFELRKVWIPLVRQRIVDAAIREAHEHEEQLSQDSQKSGNGTAEHGTIKASGAEAPSQ